MSVCPEIYRLYESCRLCPRACGVNRLREDMGVCGQTHTIKLACACLHRGEEPPLCGEQGSGTLFFSGCTLKCESCQNTQISLGALGGEVTPPALADIMCRLQALGAANINLVTGTHFLPGILYALDLARGRGLDLPVVWNTSGYEQPDMIRLLGAGYADIFLTDIKTLDPDLARILCNAADYPARAAEAARLMTALKPPLWKHGLLKQGVIVRHLVIPGEIASTGRVIDWYRRECGRAALFSLMLQFLPVQGAAGETSGIRAGGRLSKHECDAALSLLYSGEIAEGFVQEPAEDDSWLPDFTRPNPFPVDCATPVWHYRYGFVRHESGSP
jgi:putative pyruvate formate lyase activating enzyme